MGCTPGAAPPGSRTTKAFDQTQATVGPTEGRTARGHDGLHAAEAAERRLGADAGVEHVVDHDGIKHSDVWRDAARVHLAEGDLASGRVRRAAGHVHGVGDVALHFHPA